MICYKDTTFCVSQNCQNKCGRKLTEADKLGSLKSGLLLAVANFCDPPKKENNMSDHKSISQITKEKIAEKLLQQQRKKISDEDKEQKEMLLKYSHAMGEVEELKYALSQRISLKAYIKLMLQLTAVQGCAMAILFHIAKKSDKEYLADRRKILEKGFENIRHILNNAQNAQKDKE